MAVASQSLRALTTSVNGAAYELRVPSHETSAWIRSHAPRTSPLPLIASALAHDPKTLWMGQFFPLSRNRGSFDGWG